MALFNSKQDQDLPLLTQVYQLEFDREGEGDDRAELKEFAIRRAPWDIPEARVRIGMNLQMPGVGDPPALKAQMDELARVCKLAHRVMETLAEPNHKIANKDLRELTDFKPVYPTRTYNIYDNQGELYYPKRDEQIPISWVKPARVDVQPIPALTAQIADALWAFIYDPSTAEDLKQCTYCHNLFQANREKTTQLYCSNRCGNRARVKRHAHRKESELMVENH